MMAQRLVKRAVNALSLGYQDDGPAAHLERGVDIPKRAEVVLDVFDHV